MSRPLFDAPQRRSTRSASQLFAPRPDEASPPAAVARRPANASQTRRVARSKRSDATAAIDALTPRGVYAEVVRPVLEALIVIAVLPLALALAAPIALVNWFVFKDVRKILFRQERVGHRGQVFSINKFRTMKDVDSTAFASWSGAADGSRVTRFGRFLRNSHLDELPQLINVVRGQMSLIGPRPEMVEIETWANSEVPGFGDRLAVRPGITGWAQITQGYVGRCTDGYKRKHALGIEYLERFGARQDCEILLRTALWMVRRKGWRWQEQGVTNAKTGAP